MQTQMKLALILAGSLWFQQEEPLCAAPVPRDTVRQAVETWVRRATADPRPNASAEKLEPFRKGGAELAYIVHLRGGGYCLAGADSLALPVYWYSPQGAYDPANPETRAILEEIATRSERLRREAAAGGAPWRAYRQALERRARQWEQLGGGDPVYGDPRGDSAAELVLPLTCEWEQGDPYNGACPEEPPGSGNRCLVGCVATAMAQLMYYWRWPDAYRWDLLRDLHAAPPDAGDTEAARLCYDAGLAVNMNYGLNESSAQPYRIPGALSGTFDYDADAIFENRDLGAMVDEINWLRPLLLGGRTTEDFGHRWVVFGYRQADGQLQFKMNLGWGAGYIGWYTVDQVPQGLTEDQTQVTRIAPRGAVRFVGATSAGDGSPNAPYVDIREAVFYAPENVTLIFKAGSTNTFDGPVLTIHRPLTLKGVNATIRNR